VVHAERREPSAFNSERQSRTVGQNWQNWSEHAPQDVKTAGSTGWSYVVSVLYQPPPTNATRKVRVKITFSPASEPFGAQLVLKRLPKSPGNTRVCT